MITFIKYKLKGENGDVQPAKTIARQINTATGNDKAPTESIRLSLFRE
jgi:hypothetical protein